MAPGKAPPSIIGKLKAQVNVALTSSEFTTALAAIGSLRAVRAGLDRIH